MKKKILYLLLTIGCIGILGGCENRKVTNEYYKEVVGVISNKEYTPSRTETGTIPVFTGKVMILIPKSTFIPEEYRTTVKADGISKTFYDEQFYKRYKINDNINVKILYTEYNDGSVDKSFAKEK